MPLYLKQSTASQEIPLGPFLNDTDGNTEEAGLTIANTDIKIWKAGATTLASKNSGGATYISNGVYYCVLDATDTDTLGSLKIFIHVAGALAVVVECVVLAAMVYDSLIGGGDVLQADVTQWLGTAVATPTTAGVPEVDVTFVSGQSQTARDLGATLGVAGAGLTAVAWNPAWDAEVQSEVNDALNEVIADSIPADGSLGSLRQMVYMMTQFLTERELSGTTITINKADGTTTLFTLTLDSATTPTSVTRAT